MAEIHWSHFTTAGAILSLILVMNKAISGIFESWLYLLVVIVNSITIVIGTVAYYRLQSDRKKYFPNYMKFRLFETHSAIIDNELLLSMKRFVTTCFWIHNALTSGAEITYAGRDLLVRVQNELQSFDRNFVTVDDRLDVDEAKRHLNERLNSLLDYDETSIFVQHKAPPLYRLILDWSCAMLLQLWNFLQPIFLQLLNRLTNPPPPQTQHDREMTMTSEQRSAMLQKRESLKGLGLRNMGEQSSNSKHIYLL